MKSLELYSVEEQKMFKILVSDEEYEEVITNENMHLATKLLERQQEKDNFKAAFEVIRSSSSLCTDTSTASSSSHGIPNKCNNISFLEATTSNNPTEPVETTECTKIWTEEATKYLIKLCEIHDKEFESGVKKFIWAKIATKMTEKFKQSYNSQQCDTKWKGLKNMYKLIKKHNEQSGNNRKEWKFYNLMNEILFAKPEINALATCSSINGLVINSASTLTQGIGENTLIDEDSSGPNTPRSEPESFHSSFMRKRRSTENAAERRHTDKMARQDRYLHLLERLTTAVERSVPQNLEAEDP